MTQDLKDEKWGIKVSTAAAKLKGSIQGYPCAAFVDIYR